MHFRQNFVHNQLGKIRLDQHDCAHAIESLQCPSSARDDQALTPWEVSALRGLSGSLQWLAAQTMRWIQEALSMLQGEEHTVGTMRKLNKLLRQAQQSFSRPLIFHCHRAPWAVSRVWRRRPFVVAVWHSGRCRRIARSSFSAEVHAAGEAPETSEYVRPVIVDLVFQYANMWNANEHIAL